MRNQVMRALLRNQPRGLKHPPRGKTVPNRPVGGSGLQGCEASRHLGRSGTAGRFGSQHPGDSGRSGRFGSRHPEDSGMSGRFGSQHLGRWGTSGRFGSRRSRVSGTSGRFGSRRSRVSGTPGRFGSRRSSSPCVPVWIPCSSSWAQPATALKADHATMVALPPAPQSRPADRTQTAPCRRGRPVDPPPRSWESVPG